MKRIGMCGLALLVAFAVTAWSQEQAGATARAVAIKGVAISATSPASGEEMFEAYCSACHGLRGKGDGPAASALVVPPADLSAVADRNGGRYPGDYISYVLRMGVETPAHGTKGMPVWGPLFHSLDGGSSGNDPMIQMRIANLTRYIESLQARASASLAASTSPR